MELNIEDLFALGQVCKELRSRVLIIPFQSFWQYALDKRNTPAPPPGSTMKAHEWAIFVYRDRCQVRHGQKIPSFDLTPCQTCFKRQTRTLADFFVQIRLCKDCVHIRSASMAQFFFPQANNIDTASYSRRKK